VAAPAQTMPSIRNAVPGAKTTQPAQIAAKPKVTVTNPVVGRARY
jgi:hypothetical protein